MSDQAFQWWAGDSAGLPTAQGWIRVGPGGLFTQSADGVRIRDTSTGSGCYYWRKLFDADRRNQDRSLDRVDFQFEVTGYSQAAAWSSGASPVIAFICDGRRWLGLSVGSTLQFVHPFTGAIIYEVKVAWPWTLPENYLFRKIGTEAWELWIGGALVASIGYALAPTSASLAPSTGFGSLDSSGVSDSLWDQIEVGLNGVLVPQSAIMRAVMALPSPLRNRWNGTGRALLRSVLGLIEGGIQAIRDVWPDLQAGQRLSWTAKLSGKTLPSLADPVWTETGDILLVRERIRLRGDGLAIVGASVDAPLPAAGLPAWASVRLMATWTPRAYTPDSDGRVGPGLRIWDGTKIATLELLVDSGLGYWALTDGARTGAVVTLGSVKWPCSLDRSSSVGLVLLGSAWLLILVDGRIVDRVPYTFLPADVHTAPGGDFSSYGQAGPPSGAVGAWDAQDIVFEVSTTDTNYRTGFMQAVREAAIPVGGWETGAELAVWMQSVFGVQAMRGTTQGILVELWRLTGNLDSFVVQEETPGDWFLELTYPDVTPIWLEFNGYLQDVYVEFSWGSLNFTPDTLAAWAARYLVPVSVLELEYHICFASVMSAPSSVPTPGITEYTVKTVEGFAVGDAVSIRDAANTTREDRVILTITPPFTLTTAETVATWSSGDVLRKELLST